MSATHFKGQDDGDDDYKHVKDLSTNSFLLKFSKPKWKIKLVSLMKQLVH